MKVFIINLDRSIDRLAQQEQQFSKLGITFERIPALSVSDISLDLYKQYATKAQRLLKQSELACLFSHKKAWEQVIKENQPCVILEDDAVLSNDFSHILTQLEKTPLTNIDFINLEVHTKPKIISRTPIQTLKNHQLFALFLDKSGAAGYILYPTGATKLLKYLSHKIELADSFIFECPTLNKAQIEPAIVIQSDKCHLHNIPFDEFPIQSMIGVIKNTFDFKLTLLQKLQLKRNRIIGQLLLGIRTLKALSKGVKRRIIVDNQRFIQANHNE